MLLGHPSTCQRGDPTESKQDDATRQPRRPVARPTPPPRRTKRDAHWTTAYYQRPPPEEGIAKAAYLAAFRSDHVRAPVAIAPPPLLTLEDTRLVEQHQETHPLPAIHLGEMRACLQNVLHNADLTLPTLSLGPLYGDTDEKRLTRRGVAKELHDLTSRYLAFLQKLVVVDLLYLATVKHMAELRCVV